MPVTTIFQRYTTKFKWNVNGILAADVFSNSMMIFGRVPVWYNLEDLDRIMKQLVCI